MSNEIVNLASIQDRVKQSIQSQFAGLITDGEWDLMVSGHIQAFIRTELPGIVKREAERVALEMVRAELQKPEWTESWATGTSRPGPMLAEVLKVAAPEMVNALFAGVAQNLVNAIRSGSMGRY